MLMHLRRLLPVVTVSLGAAALLLPRSAAALTAGDRAALSAPRIILGGDPGEQFGATLAMPGDVTGDGVPDLLVGAPEAREGSGRVYLFSGADMLDSRALRASAAWAVFEGAAGTGFGSRLAVLGDLDGDGWTDWGVGAPTFPGGDVPPGRLWLVSGAATVGVENPGTIDAIALAVVDGPNPSARMGEGFGAAGDIDGDGLADVAVVTRDEATAAGTGGLRVIHGRAAGNWPSGSSLAGLTGPHWQVVGLGDPALGFTLSDLTAQAGDLDGDGLGDLWLGVPGRTAGATRGGALHLIAGRARDAAGAVAVADVALTTFVPDPTLFGSVDLVDAHFGQPVFAFDGVVWVGADGPDRGTAIGLIVGPAPYVTGANMAGAVAAPPAVLGGLSLRRADLDGDGVTGFVVGVPTDGAGPGVAGAGLFAVLDAGSEAIAEVDDAYALFLGAEGHRVGAAVEVANLDFDAYDDAFVGAPGLYGAGAVLLLLGEDLADGDGVAPKDGDCDDSTAAVRPGALEIAACDDALDNDCNGLVDGADGPCAVEGSGLVVSCSAVGPLAPTALIALLGVLAIGLRRRRALAPAVALLLVGCTTPGPADAPPEIVIVSPDAGERLPDSSVLAVVVEVTGARLAPELAGADPAEQATAAALWALSVDGFFRGQGGGPVLVAEGLGPGLHTVRAELVDTLGQAFDPAVATEITVEIVAGEPTVLIAEPLDGEVLPPAGFAVEYDVGGFLLNAASIGQPNQLGVGHALVRLGEALVATDADGAAFVANPGAGEHELSVALVNNDGTPLNPPVSHAIQITVAEPSVTITSPTGTIAGGAVTIEYEVANFTLDPVNINGAPEDGSGHVHVYLDGLYQGLDAHGSFTLPGIDGCEHTLRLELALAGHVELAISDEQAFSVRPCVAVDGLAPNQNVSGPTVNIPYAAQGHVVDGTPPQIGGRYVTHHLDGAYVGYSFLPGNATFFDVPPGEHLFQIRLAEGPVGIGEEDEGALSPRASTSIVLNVQ